ncbi:MAG: hypothetical protein KJ645_01330 [Planctomycetes bacterium]|nr:hypothetical protein [Planctomycetota bacterium]
MTTARSKVEYIITAGGTREPIDDVRYIGNSSTGRLGAAVADRAFTRGHRVLFIHGIDCAMPECIDAIESDPYSNSADLENRLEQRVRAATHPAVVVHAAAVADFLPERVHGKISSGRKEDLILRFSQAKKIVDLIKFWNPKILLVKFKLESNLSQDQLLEIGRACGRLSQADWVVANDISAITQTKHKAFIIEASGEYQSANTKVEIAEKLVDLIDKRAMS